MFARIFVVLFLLTLGACSTDDTVTTPTPVDAPLARAVVENGTGTFNWEGEVTLDCVDEPLYVTVVAPYRYRLVQLPGGGSIYVETWDADRVTGTMTGLVTGTEWIRTRTVSPLVAVDHVTQILTYTAHAVFVSDTGPTIRVNEIYHRTVGPDGEQMVEVAHLDCR